MKATTFLTGIVEPPLVLSEVTPRTVEFPTVLGDLPNELFPVIVGGDVKVHHGLALACKRFFAALTPISYSMKIDYEICAGHTVEITKKSIKWYVDGKLHRGGDQPAVKEVNGTKIWRINGKLHRDGDRPAVEDANGTKKWYVNGKLHRDGDQPAIEWAVRTKVWYVKGKCHRGGDRPAIERADGTKVWRINGKLHRDGDRPAIEWMDGTREWWVNGKRHRMNGPAVEKASGRKEWWVNGILSISIEL